MGVVMESSAEFSLEGLPGPWQARRALPAGETPPLGDGSLPAPASLEIPGGPVLVVVNDAQRATPTPWLLGRLAIDWNRTDIEFAVAGGSHRPPGEEELQTIFGPFLQRVRSRLILHDARKAGLLLGTTGRGTPVEVHPGLKGRAAVICLGSVEPHYFAGWTGGRKSLVPGLASLETMRRNHRLAMEGGMPGRPELCPVSRDLDDALALCTARLGREYGTRFIALNVVAREDGVYGCHWGPVEEAVGSLDERARKLYGRRTGGRADIVLARVSPPLDRDLYQALKAFENWKHAVAPGGTLALVAACPEGIGPPHFVQFLDAPPALADLQGRTEETYRLGDHKISNYLAYFDGGRRLALISGGPVDAVRAVLAVDRETGDFFAREESLRAGESVSVLVADAAADTYPVDLPATPSL